jgi:hypothetical protein
MPGTIFVSRYEQRIAFVQNVLSKNSELGDEPAHDLAVKILAAIDNIPEQIGR